MRPLFMRLAGEWLARHHPAGEQLTGVACLLVSLARRGVCHVLADVFATFGEEPLFLLSVEENADLEGLGWGKLAEEDAAG